MPKRTTGLTDAHARLHKNHSYELLVCTWLMNGGWQVFMPMLDAAHAVDLIVSDGPHSYRLQIKSLESQDENRSVQNYWKGKHIDFVIYFAQRSNWGYAGLAGASVDEVQIGFAIRAVQAEDEVEGVRVGHELGSGMLRLGVPRMA